jgi:rSAM/selenodomain-associated transferase 1
MTFAQEIILLLTRLPQPGKSKTRLIPALGAEGAAELQRTMTLMMSEIIRAIAKECQVCTEVHYTGGSREEMEKWLGADLTYKPQHEGDIGTRMYTAITQHLGYHKSIILIGSDCPAIDAPLLQSGLAALQHNDIVIGPAFDGGYYLIGVQGSIRQNDLKYLFSDIIWGTEEVLRQTRERLHTLKLRYHLLKKLHDIDTPEDLRYFHHYSRS